MNRTLVICFGPVCSGKTTWAIEYQRLNSKFLRFSFDEYLYMTTGSGKYSGVVANSSPGAIMSMLARTNVVVDSFPLSMTLFKMLLNNRLTYGAKVEIRIFDVRFDEALKRNNIRRNETGKFVSLEQMRTYRKIHEDFINDPDFQEAVNYQDISTIYDSASKLQSVF